MSGSSSIPEADAPRCTRCVLPRDFPGMRFDESGQCGLCRRSPTREQMRQRRTDLRARLETLFGEVRGRAPYDLLMAYSGGKDSSYTLSLLRREFDLKILAVTLDNGFLPKATLANIRRVTDQLGVDHALLRPRLDLLLDLFRETAKRDIFAASTLARASSICTACIAVVKFSVLRMAIERAIPVVGYGWSPGQAPVNSALLRPNPPMLEKMQEVLFDPIRSTIGPEAKQWFLPPELLDQAGAIPYLVSPLAAFEYDEALIFAELHKIGWRRPRGVDANSTNCRLNALANHIHRRRHGYHPYVLELAGLVREGCLTREEALSRLRPDSPASVESSRRLLGLSRQEVYS